jgi:sulfur carrier protein
VAELLIELALLETRGIAVALNDEVVPRAEWSTRALVEGDALVIIRASQGG